MIDEITKLKQELKSLEIKYKKKCEKLNNVNKQLKLIQERLNRRGLWDHIKLLEIDLYGKLTGNIEQYVYEVTYTYNEKTYVEDQVLSYGSRYLLDCLAIHIGRNHDIICYKSYLKIISARKLW